MENKKAAKVLFGAFRGLRSAHTVSNLDWFHVYICGAVTALEGTGCISNSEGTKILKRSNALYNERREKFVKEKLAANAANQQQQN